MSGVIRESISFFEVIALAAEYAEREGKVSEKKLKKALGVHLPTAAKAICALAVTGVVGRKEKKYYPFTAGRRPRRGASRKKPSQRGLPPPRGGGQGVRAHRR